MKNRKRYIFGILLTFIICLLSNPFSAMASEVPTSFINTNVISPWAQESVIEAYETGLISKRLALGEDYTQCITRLQFARMAVDFIASEKDTSALTFANDFGLVFQDGDTQKATGNEAYSFADNTVAEHLHI